MGTPPLAELARSLDPALILDDLGLDADGWQRDLLRCRAERILILSARQVGKSTAAAALAIGTALDAPGSLVLLISPSLRQSGELFRKVVDGYRALGRPVSAVQDSATTLSLVGGSRIVSLPCSEATVRGFSAARLLVIDEAARVPDDLYFATLPMLATSRGRLVALSTPFGRRGWYHDAWHSLGGPWHRVKVPARDCPRLDPTFLAEQRALLGPRWYAQEWDCCFEEAQGQFFATETIEAAFAPAEDSPFRPLLNIGA